MEPGAAGLVAGAVALGAVAAAVTNIVAFAMGIKWGLRWIDWFYPWPQNHKVFRSMQAAITAHVFLNGFALLVGTLMVFPGLWPKPAAVDFGLLLPIYVTSLVLGSCFSIRFSWANAAHKLAGSVSFVFMALGSIFPALMASVAQASDRHDDARKWLAKSYAALWGAGVLFRVLAVIGMPRVPSEHKREMWLVLIWVSWAVPQAFADSMLSIAAWT
jgi:hypothetical protein